MGDEKRNIIFAEFIARNYAKRKNVLVVADGKGGLARRLANKGFHCRIIEAKPRWEGRAHPSVTYEKGWFSRDSQISEDLVVGMHPDEATAEIILAAKLNNIPFCLVPCCILGEESKGVQGFSGWIKKLHYLSGFTAREKTLSISGRNLCLYERN